MGLPLASQFSDVLPSMATPFSAVVEPSPALKNQPSAEWPDGTLCRNTPGRKDRLSSATTAAADCHGVGSTECTTVAPDSLACAVESLQVPCPRHLQWWVSVLPDGQSSLRRWLPQQVGSLAPEMASSLFSGRRSEWRGSVLIPYFKQCYWLPIGAGNNTEAAYHSVALTKAVLVWLVFYTTPCKGYSWQLLKLITVANVMLACSQINCVVQLFKVIF